MTNTQRTVLAALATGLLLIPASAALAQTATVTLGSQKQYIRGFGGISHAAWLGDLNATDRSIAFGNADGQLGFTVLRIPVSDGNPDSANVATAKAAIAAGAIVFASPWNAYHVYTSADFPAYVTHLNNFVTYMAGQGVNLYAISVQNEPDWGMTSKSWGAWTAESCHDFVLNYGSQIKGAMLMSCESFGYNKAYYDPILNDPAALANMGVLGTHIYGSDATNYASKLPYPLFDTNGAGKERWMTEHYTDSTTDANSWPNALGVATELHYSMVAGQFNAYVFWPIKRVYGPIYTNDTISKRGYCMAHWSKFVRPGFHRVDATASPASNVLLSAYKSDTDVVIVMVNNNTSSASLTISVNGSTIGSYDKFTTSSSKSLANDGKLTAANGSISVTLDAQSVTTLHGSGSVTASGGAGGAGGAAGAGGSPGSGGASLADAGRDGSGVRGGGGTAATTGSGGTAGPDAAPDVGGGPGASAATGGRLAMGGAGGAAAGGNAGGGQLGSGGVAISTGGAQGGLGGATEPGKGSGGGSNANTIGAGNGCTCQMGGRLGTLPPLALFVLVALLVL